MTKSHLKKLIEEEAEKSLKEHREELAADYRNNLEKNHPELHDDLVKLANFAIDSVQNGYTPSKRAKQLGNILKIEPDMDPGRSGDTHGVRLYIDHLVDDNALAGQAKRWYQSTLDVLLKKRYTIPKKKRKKEFEKSVERRVKQNKRREEKKKREEEERKEKEEKEREREREKAKKESIDLKKSINLLIESAFTNTLNKDFLFEETRKSFNMKIPSDLKHLADIFNEAGHELYVVGGAVRDALLGKDPKDYDVATDAKPDRVLELLSQFPEYKTLEVGKAFGVVNVITPNKNEYEIATFREDIGSGRRPDAVAFSTIEQDVKRRDLTINALFYDISSKEVVDYVGGLEDLEKGRVRAVGEASDRFDEDRLRILRAIRFAARMNAGLGEETENAILNDNSLEGVSAERIRDEFIKSIKTAKSVVSLFRMYEQFDLWKQIFPGLTVNTWYKETNNVPVQLALLLRDNSHKTLSKKLNELKYSALETKQVTFLNMFQGLSPENAYQLKRLWQSTQLSNDDLQEFAKLAGKPKNDLVRAFVQYSPSVSGKDLLAQGYSGKELGQELERQEMELFKELL